MQEWDFCFTFVLSKFNIMELSKLIDVRQNYEKSVKQRLLEFTTFFHSYMWDGCSDDEENNPKYLSNADYEALGALADKMEHMIFNIGCPTSIKGMLNSIVERKIKHWQAYGCVESENSARYEYDKTLGKGRIIITLFFKLFDILITFF